MKIMRIRVVVVLAGILLHDPTRAFGQCPRQPIPAGHYLIVSSMDGFCMDRRSQDANVLQYLPCNGTVFQQFELVLDSQQCYQIRPVVDDQGSSNFRSLLYLFPALERVGLDTMSITRESRSAVRSWTTQQTACSRTSGELLRVDVVDCVSKVHTLSITWTLTTASVWVQWILAAVETQYFMVSARLVWRPGSEPG